MHCPNASGVTGADDSVEDCVEETAVVDVWAGEPADSSAEHATTEPNMASAARPENAVRAKVCLMR